MELHRGPQAEGESGNLDARSWWNSMIFRWFSHLLLRGGNPLFKQNLTQKLIYRKMK